MGKKRRRVQLDPHKLEFDPSFFDASAEASGDSAASPSADSDINSRKHEAASASAGQATPASRSAAAAIERTPELPQAYTPRSDSGPESETNSAKPEGRAATEHPNVISTDITTSVPSSVVPKSQNSPEVIELGSSMTEIDLCDDTSSDSGRDDDYDNSDFEAVEIIKRRGATRAVQAVRKSSSLADASEHSTDASPAGSGSGAHVAKGVNGARSPVSPATELSSNAGLPLQNAERREGSVKEQVRREDSLRQVPILVKCEIPGHESNFEVQWSWSQSFFDLREEFGSEAVLVHDGSRKPWFYSPKKFGDTKGPVLIQIFTDRQWEDLVRKEELGDFMIPSSTPDEDFAGAPDANEEQGFLITLASKLDPVRAKVAQDTTVKQLVDHFRAETQTPASSRIRVVFDGDTLKESDTLGELDIEEDDCVDIHIE